MRSPVNFDPIGSIGGLSLLTNLRVLRFLLEPRFGGRDPPGEVARHVIERL